MEYGILVAENMDEYQIIGAVWGMDECRELTAHYLLHGPHNDWLAPERFVVMRRGSEGGYTVREVI